MKLIIVAALLGLATLAFSQSTSHTGRGQSEYPLTYDTLYDGKQNPLTDVVCSNGQYGLMTKGYNTFDQIPTYPAIGGIPMIDAWDSPNCGTCWKLTYTDANGNSVFTFFTAINSGVQNPDGFTISQETMNYLTGNNAEALDGTTISVAQMLADNCGL